MSQYIALVAFGTFGNPNGFKQSFFGLRDKDFARSVKTFDLKTDAIQLFPNCKIYSLRKEFANGNNTITYSIYTFAKEQNSERGGTFIGSSILFTNKIADENVTVNCLNEFHNTLIDNNIQNDIIAVNHSEKFKIGEELPKDFKNLELNLKEIEDLNFIQSSSQNLVVYNIVNPNELSQLFKKSMDLLNAYDTIYFTSDKEVAQFVIKKGIFRLVENEGFQQELLNLQDQRRQKVELSISELGKEKLRLENDRIRLIEDYNKQIEQNEKLHEENKQKIEESKIEIKSISQKYESYAKKIDELVNQLKSGNKLEAVKQLHNENKRIFIESVNEQKKPAFVNKISKSNVKTSLKANFQPINYEQTPSNYENRGKRNNGYEIDIFKVISFVLFLSLIAMFLFNRKKKSDPIVTQPQQNKVSIVEEPKPEIPSNKELNPKPNSTLNERDYLNVAKKIRQGMDLQEVVQKIFDANPTEIKNIYSDQIDVYSKRLIEENKDCFKEINSHIFLAKDTLINIPSYKKDLE